MKTKVLVIVGPTASGKSALGVRLARAFNGEIISADSRQVYKGLDIGTGKITKKEMRGIPHHLLDVASPKKNFSAGDFVARARDSIKDISARGKLPIIVGGTGFYIDTLVGRIPLPNVPANKKLRSDLQKKTVRQLFTLLRKRDPQRARMMDTPSERNNKVRLIRALEIARDKSKKISRLNLDIFDIPWLGIRPPLPVLEKKIQERLRQRIVGGMIAEAKRLHGSGLSYKRMEELGLEYRSLSRLLQKRIAKVEFEAELQRDIRRYAKKQLSYWRRNKDIRWFRPTERAKIEKMIREWLKK